MTESDTRVPASESRIGLGSALAASLVAWLIPGAGHLYLKRVGRGVAFFVLVVVTLWIGIALKGHLYRPLPNEPLSVLGTIGQLGFGSAYAALRYALHYQGDIRGAGFEYGTAFLITAGLMNLLLVFDAWDIALGKKD